MNAKTRQALKPLIVSLALHPLGGALFMAHARLAFGQARQLPEALDLPGAFALLAITGALSSASALVAFYRGLGEHGWPRYRYLGFVILCSASLFGGLMYLYALAIFIKLA